MSSESDNEGSCDWIFYKDRPDWKDLKPIPQDDGPNPVVRIAYTDKCEYENGHVRVDTQAQTYIV